MSDEELRNKIHELTAEQKEQFERYLEKCKQEEATIAPSQKEEVKQ